MLLQPRQRNPKGNEIQTSHSIQLMEDWAPGGATSVVGINPNTAEKIVSQVRFIGMVRGWLYKSIFIPTTDGFARFVDACAPLWLKPSL